MIYKFKHGGFGSGSGKKLDAQKVGEELERIRQRDNGRLLTKNIIEDAKSDESPLHDAFTWDIREAAYKCWIKEASALITRVVVDVDGDYRPAFINITVKQDSESDDSRAVHAFQAIHVLTEKPDDFEAALEHSRKRLFDAQESLDHLHAISKQPTQQAMVRRAQKHIQFATRELKIDEARV